MEWSTFMQNNEALSDKSKRINGFWFLEYLDNYYANKEIDSIQKDDYYQDIKSGKYRVKTKNFSIEIINSLEKFIKWYSSQE